MRFSLFSLVPLLFLFLSIPGCFSFPSRYMYLIDSAEPIEFGIAQEPVPMQVSEPHEQGREQSQDQTVGLSSPGELQGLLDPTRIQELVDEALARSPFNPANLNLQQVVHTNPNVRQLDADNEFLVAHVGDGAIGSFGQANGVGPGAGIGFPSGPGSSTTLIATNKGPGAGASFVPVGSGLGGNKGFPAPIAIGGGNTATAFVIPTGGGKGFGPGNGGAIVIPSGKGFGPGPAGGGSTVVINSGKGGIGGGAGGGWAWPAGFGPSSLAGVGAGKGFGPGSSAAFSSKGPFPGSGIATVINNGPTPKGAFGAGIVQPIGFGLK
jgi:hypothetical protein